MISKKSNFKSQSLFQWQKIPFLTNTSLRENENKLFLSLDIVAANFSVWSHHVQFSGTWSEYLVRQHGLSVEDDAFVLASKQMREVAFGEAGFTGQIMKWCQSNWILPLAHQLQELTTLGSTGALRVVYVGQDEIILELNLEKKHNLVEVTSVVDSSCKKIGIPPHVVKKMPFEIKFVSTKMPAAVLLVDAKPIRFVFGSGCLSKSKHILQVIAAYESRPCDEIDLMFLMAKQWHTIKKAFCNIVKKMDQVRTCLFSLTTVHRDERLITACYIEKQIKAL